MRRIKFNKYDLSNLTVFFNNNGMPFLIGEKKTDPVHEDVLSVEFKLDKEGKIYLFIKIRTATKDRNILYYLNMETFKKGVIKRHEAKDEVGNDESVFEITIPIGKMSDLIKGKMFQLKSGAYKEPLNKDNA